jgi:hypothetical protein
MSGIGILRLIVGMIGVVVCFVSLINVWMTWMRSADTSFHWTIAVIGGVLWLQALPILQASDREERRQRFRKMLKGEGD